MSFKAMAEIKINPDGTITGKLLAFPAVEGIGLVDNGVYTVGYDDWHNRVAIKFSHKEDQKQ